MDPIVDLTGSYNTPLSPDEEIAFDKWPKERSAESGRDVSKDLYNHEKNTVLVFP